MIRLKKLAYGRLIVKFFSKALTPLVLICMLSYGWKLNSAYSSRGILGNSGGGESKSYLKDVWVFGKGFNWTLIIYAISSFLIDSAVTKWSRLVEKSLAKQKLDFNKTSDNARSVFLQLAKKETNRSQKLAQVWLVRNSLA